MFIFTRFRRPLSYTKTLEGPLSVGDLYMVFSYRRASRGLPTIEGPIAMEELKRSSRFKGTRSY